jgi:hypothetical protein
MLGSLLHVPCESAASPTDVADPENPAFAVEVDLRQGPATKLPPGEPTR